jgi:hypothetical protein
MNYDNRDVYEKLAGPYSTHCRPPPSDRSRMSRAYLRPMQDSHCRAGPGRTLRNTRVRADSCPCGLRSAPLRRWGCLGGCSLSGLRLRALRAVRASIGHPGRLVSNSLHQRCGGRTAVRSRLRLLTIFSHSRSVQALASPEAKTSDIIVYELLFRKTAVPNARNAHFLEADVVDGVEAVEDAKCCGIELDGWRASQAERRGRYGVQINPSLTPTEGRISSPLEGSVGPGHAPRVDGLSLARKPDSILRADRVGSKRSWTLLPRCGAAY